MLSLVFDVLQSPLHAFLVLLFEGDDVGEGRWRLRARVCLAGGVRNRFIDLLLLWGLLLVFQHFFVFAVELLDELPFSVNTMQFIVFLLLRVCEILLQLIGLIRKQHLLLFCFLLSR